MWRSTCVPALRAGEDELYVSHACCHVDDCRLVGRHQILLPVMWRPTCVPALRAGEDELSVSHACCHVDDCRLVG